MDYYLSNISSSKDTFLNNSYHSLNQYFEQIYVITLPQRKTYIQNIMRKINLNCFYYPAFLKKNINKQELIKSGFLSPQFKINEGQIACHLSHILVLKKFLKSNFRNCLIFEDDLKIPQVSSSLLDVTMSMIPRNYDIIYLGRCWDSCKKTTHLNNYVVKCHAPQCRHAYGVSRKGAEKIIRLTQPLINAGDATISKYIQTGQIIAYAPTKSFFFQNRQQLGSNLNNLSIQKECV